jgi:hypothetical protein
MRLPDAHDLASRLEDDIREDRLRMTDAAVHRPVTAATARGRASLSGAQVVVEM